MHRLCVPMLPLTLRIRDSRNMQAWILSKPCLPLAAPALSQMMPPASELHPTPPPLSASSCRLNTAAGPWDGVGSPAGAGAACGLEPLYYTSVPEVKDSDHRPVIAGFRLDIHAAATAGEAHA